MLRTRLWMGGLLILLTAGVLVFDVFLAPHYPILVGVALAATLLAVHELVILLPEPGPRRWLCYVGVAAMVAFPWVGNWFWPDSPVVLYGLVAMPAAMLAIFMLVEAANFHGPSQAVTRLSLGFWAVLYVGYLASFVLCLRWLFAEERAWYGSLALALAIFVPKFCDIGAYTLGRVFGRHRMAPVLSPKKTWEGAVGGLIAAVLAAFAINALGWLIPDGGPLLSWPSAAGFGLAVGAAGMLGDLVESMIKRDCQRKDASDLVPGFGGVLDVLDAILFSAPVSFGWIVVARG